MSRYLTPAKIALLTLISLYAESVVPSAATVPVLSFLVPYILPISSTAPPNRSSLQSQHVTPSIEDFQRAISGLVSGRPGRTIWDLLLDKLWRLDSFDTLTVYFEALSSLLQKTPEEQQHRVKDGPGADSKYIRLSRASPMGFFVRRAQLEFTRLQFHDGVALWKSFVAYRASTFLLWKKRNHYADHISFDTNLRKERLHFGDRLTDVMYGQSAHGAQPDVSISTEDVEKLLEHQIDQMQSALELGWDLTVHADRTLAMGNRLPQVMKSKLRAMIDAGMVIPNLSHYVK